MTKMFSDILFILVGVAITAGIASIYVSFLCFFEMWILSEISFQLAVENSIIHTVRGLFLLIASGVIWHLAKKIKT